MRFSRLAVLAAITAPGAAFVVPNQRTAFRRSHSSSSLSMAAENELVQAGLEAARIWITPLAAFAASQRAASNRAVLKEELEATEIFIEDKKKEIQSADLVLNVSESYPTLHLRDFPLANINLCFIVFANKIECSRRRSSIDRLGRFQLSCRSRLGGAVDYR